MIKTENYPKAYKEVYIILRNMDENQVKKIPESFIDMLKVKMDDNYNFVLDEDMKFENQTLLRETKVILAYLFLNYWGTKEQNDKITRRFEQDIIEENQAKLSYNPDEIFKSRKIDITTASDTQKEEVRLIEYDKQNVLVKIWNKIRNLFKKINKRRK